MQINQEYTHILIHAFIIHYWCHSAANCLSQRRLYTKTYAAQLKHLPLKWIGHVVAGVCVSVSGMFTWHKAFIYIFMIYTCTHSSEGEKTSDLEHADTS